MSDETVIRLSQMSGDVPEPFQSKQWLYINDSNNSSYSGGQVSFDLSSLANSGRWINWTEATLQIPVVFGYKLGTNNTQAKGALGLAWKNGWHHLVDSMEVMFGNTSVSQITPYTNMFVSFKLLSTMCQDQYHKYGALLNFFKDDGLAYGYSATASPYGAGTSCNDIVQTLSVYSGANSYPRVFNSGLLKRAYNTNLPVGSPGLLAGGGVLTQLGVSTFQESGSGADKIYYTKSIATIRLKDISDFFNRLGLCKGAFIKLTLNLNSGQVVSTTTGTSVDLPLTSAGITIQGRTIPFMCSATTANSPLAAAMAVSGESITMGSAISKLTLGSSSVSNDLLSSCRLYVPAYSMTADAEQAYLDANPVRDIVYDDIYQFTIGGVETGQSFTQLISNAIIAPQYLLVVPLISSKSGENVATQSVSPIASPFTSEPATTSGGVAIGQFNVQLSGSNVYMQNQAYTFEQFQAEIASINALNGGQTDQMSSGLIGFDDWNTIYKYYVCDLSRGQPIDALVPKSVQVLGTNNCSKAVDYFCFIVYKRKISIRAIDSTIVA